MIRMKKIILLSVFMLAVGTWSYAQGKSTGKRPMVSNCGKGYRYMDKNSDGICDNNGAGSGWKGGKQRHRKTPPNSRGQGPRFMDKDEDGVCDNPGSGQKAK